MIRSLLMLGVVAALMASARSFMPVGDAGEAGVALGFGFVLIAAMQTGEIFAAMRLPRLTGYLVCGMLFGPAVTGLLTPSMVSGLRLVNGVAVGLIALTAGSELNFKQLRPRLRSVTLISAVALPATLLSTMVVLALINPPFFVGLSTGQRWMAACSIGVLFASLSPAIVLAMLSENAAAGPVSEVALGVVVLADIVIIVLFAVVHALAAGMFVTAGADVGHQMSPVVQLSIEIFGSMGIGVLVGLAIAAWYRFVRGHMALFILAVCVVSAEVGTRLHLDPLIINLTAGLLLENFLGLRGAIIARLLEPAALPIFAVFFALAGAKLSLVDLRAMWALALGFALLRAGALVSGGRLGAHLAGAEPRVKHWMPLVLVPQAGVSVGLAELLARHFPSWGVGANVLVMGVVTINQFLGPVLLRLALVKSDEVGKRAPGDTGH